MKDADCLFCKIIDCEVPSEKVFEDAQVYAVQRRSHTRSKTLHMQAIISLQQIIFMVVPITC